METKVVLSSKALVANVTRLRKSSGVAVSVVVKSNAYGHGLEYVVPVLDRMDLPFLVVNSFAEAEQVRKMDAKTTVLVLDGMIGEVPDGDASWWQVCLWDLNLAKRLNARAQQIKVHVFVDTGMSREGVRLEDFRGFVSELMKLKNLEIVGLASHLADADNNDDQSFTGKQVEKYKQALKMMKELGVEPKWRHIAASAGGSVAKDEVFNLIRVGLYAYTGVMRLESTVVQVKKIEKGDCVGYGCTFVAQRARKIALVGAGYYEGVDRRLSNRGSFLIRGKQCPIVGRVSMNYTTVDVSGVPNVDVGDIVIVLNDFDKVAVMIGTIPYELMTGIPSDLPREIED